jgi:hypothetical protein
MTVRADHIAFGNFGEQSLPRHEHGSGRRDVEHLDLGIAMIKVHLVWLEPEAAVLAWDSAKLSKELERRSLPGHDPVDLLLPIAAVVTDVVRALIAHVWHRSEHEQVLASRQ